MTIPLHNSATTRTFPTPSQYHHSTSQGLSTTYSQHWTSLLYFCLPALDPKSGRLDLLRLAAALIRSATTRVHLATQHHTVHSTLPNSHTRRPALLAALRSSSTLSQSSSYSSCHAFLLIRMTLTCFGGCEARVSASESTQSQLSCCSPSPQPYHTLTYTHSSNVASLNSSPQHVTHGLRLC